MNKFGPHWQQFTSEMERLIAEWQPPMGTWVDPNPEGLVKVRSAAPSMFVIGRKNEEGTWDSPNLKDRAYWWADRCAEMGRCDAYYCWNEPLWHGDLAKFGHFDDFQCWFLERMRSEHDMEAVAFNFGTGNFTKDGPDIRASFPNSCDQFRYFGGHEYDWIIDPALRPVDPDRLGYYWNRWPHWLNSIGRDDVTLWVSECGMTQAVHEGRPDEGWRSKADGMTDDDYIAWASWYNSQLVQDKRIGGAALFNFAGYGWEPFEHLGWGRLPEILALDAEPPPEPNGGDKLKIYNMEGKELGESAAADLLAKYGAAFNPPPGLGDGDWYYAVTKVWEKTGHAAFVASVKDRNGQPVVNPDEQLELSKAHRAFWWRNMGEANDIAAPYATDRETEADLGGLDANGTGGSGFGTGAYTGEYEEPEDGPHRAWIRHPTIPSVEFVGVRMLGMTNHDHLDAEWQETEYKGEEPPPGDLAAEVNAMGIRLQEISQQMDSGDISEIVVKRTGAADQVFVKKTGSGLVARVRAKARALFG